MGNLSTVPSAVWCLPFRQGTPWLIGQILCSWVKQDLMPCGWKEKRNFFPVFERPEFPLEFQQRNMGNHKFEHLHAPRSNQEPVLKLASNHSTSVFLLHLPVPCPMWFGSCLLGTTLCNTTSFLQMRRDVQTSDSGLQGPFYLHACSKALLRSRHSALITEVKFVGVAHINANDYGFVGQRSRS